MEQSKDLDLSCIFCKIISGRAPAYILFENELVIAFLDINPLHKGHTLIIPKIHHASLTYLPSKYAAACMEIVPSLSKAILAATGTDSFNIMQNNGKTAGQEVFHVHFHLIPRSKNDYMSATWARWRVDSIASHYPEDLQSKIKQQLNS